MLELIHDVAPNTALAFAAGDDTQTQMADNILALAHAGCTIVCDDLEFDDEPMFQDGPIPAQAIALRITPRAFRISRSAGNDYDHGVFATYTPVAGSGTSDTGLYPPDGTDFHDWGIGGATPGFLPIDIQGFRSLVAVLQWNQPYQSYNLGAGSSVDLDLYIYDSPSVSGNLLAMSVTVQSLNGNPVGDPLEIAEVDNPDSSTLRVYVAINHAAGSRANTIFRLVCAENSRVTFPMVPTGGNGPTIYGHTASVQAISTEAIFFADIDSGGAYGQDTAHINVEGFCSKGGIGAAGLPFFFDTTGAPFPGGPQLRDKPDLSAPDGGTTSVFGSHLTIVINGVTYLDGKLPSFFGTSAAAPNAAAVAALLKQRASLSTPAQIKNVLQSTAIDIVADMPLSVVGPDDVSGAGLINALAAATAVPGITQQPVDVLIDPGQNATFTVAAAGSATLIYQWQKNGANIPNENAPTLSLTSQPVTADGSMLACVVSNDFGTAISNPATLSVSQSPVPLAVKKLSISLNFKKSGADSLLLTGSLPLPASFIALGQSLVIKVGDAQRTITLNAKGNGTVAPDTTFALKFKAKSSAAPNGNVHAEDFEEQSAKLFLSQRPDEQEREERIRLRGNDAHVQRCFLRKNGPAIVYGKDGRFGQDEVNYLCSVPSS